MQPSGASERNLPGLPVEDFLDLGALCLVAEDEATVALSSAVRVGAAVVSNYTN